MHLLLRENDYLTLIFERYSKIFLILNLILLMSSFAWNLTLIMSSFTRILQLKFFTKFAQNLIVNNVEFYLKVCICWVLKNGHIAIIVWKNEIVWLDSFKIKVI